MSLRRGFRILYYMFNANQNFCKAVFLNLKKKKSLPSLRSYFKTLILPENEMPQINCLYMSICVLCLKGVDCLHPTRIHFPRHGGQWGILAVHALVLVKDQDVLGSTFSKVRERARLCSLFLPYYFLIV